MQKTKRHSGIFVTGTDTDVGKTWIGQAILRQLIENGVSVIPRKPVESGWLVDVTKSDAWLLAAAAGYEDDLDKVCPNRFKAAVSPVRAAHLEGRELQLNTVVDQCLRDLEKDDFLYVEGAGGFFSPLVENQNGKGLNADLAKSLNLPVLLVAQDKLGCINHVLLTLAAIKDYELPVVGVVLNSMDEGVVIGNSDINNFEDLVSLLDVPVFLTQYGQSTVADELIKLML